MEGRGIESGERDQIGDGGRFAEFAEETDGLSGLGRVGSAPGGELEGVDNGGTTYGAGEADSSFVVGNVCRGLEEQLGGHRRRARGLQFGAAMDQGIADFTIRLGREAGEQLGAGEFPG